MPPSSPVVRELTADDLDAAFAVRARAFGFDADDGGAGDPAGFRRRWDAMQEPLITDGRALVVELDDVVVAYARAIPLRQWWGGRSVSMAGIAGVVVAPEQRGRGVGSLLLRALLLRAVELGDAVSVLYPATVPVYRRLGWELAGARHDVSLDTALLRRLGGPAYAVRPARPDDAESLVGIARAVHHRSAASGPLDRGVDEVRSLLADPEMFCYLAADGFVRYGWAGGDLRVHELIAATGQTARALWSVVGSGASVARTVYAYLDPRDPLHLMLGEAVRPPVTQTRWMLRVLDLPAAVAGRGFPPAVAGAVTLTVDDPLVARSAGSWLLTVADGSGEVVAGAPDADALRLGPGGLATLFAGLPLSILRMAGLVTGGRPADDALLDAAFAAQPYLLDYF